MISQVVAGLLGCLVVMVVAQAHVMRRRYFSDAPYAGFAAAPSGEGLLCEGHCGGPTQHEADGDGTATCTVCGALRSTAAHGA